MPLPPQTIVLDLDSSRVSAGLGGLERLQAALAGIDAQVQRVSAALNNLGSAGAARSVAEVEAAIIKLQRAAGGSRTASLDVGGLAKGLGLDQAAFERHLARMGDAVSGYKKTTAEFVNARKAAQAVTGFERQQGSVARSVLKDVLTPSTASVTGGLAGAGGTVGLVIPGAQVQASVEGMIRLIVPAGQIEGMVTGTAGTRDAQGRFVPGNGSEGKKGSHGGKAGAAKAADVPQTDAELQRTIVETEDAARVMVKEADGVGQTLITTYNEVGDAIKKVTTTFTGKTLTQDLAQQRALALEGLRTAKAGLKPGDATALGQLQISQAQGLRDLLSDELKSQLDAKGFGHVAGLVEARAGTLEAQGEANLEKGKAARRAEIQAQANAAYEQRVAEQRAQEKQQVELFQADQRRQREARQAQERLQADYRKQFLSVSASHEERVQMSRDAADRKWQYNPPPKIPPPTVPGKGPFAKAFEAFTPAGAALNLVKVAGWAAAVTVLYKSIELATHSMERLVEIGGQTARLEQIFKGVGGTAQELTRDILGLAAANGRSTEEAMESGIAWARLGLTRTQINEAVRVSTMAANVANVDTATATKYLSSIMQVYGLHVSELDGVLGMLTNTNNKYNVTNQDLFEGLTRSASVAKQAGFSLAELQGILGAAVGRTGQTGSQIGNAFKSVLVSLQSPQLQQYLRQGYGIELMGKETGEMKQGPQALDELWVAYQKLNDEERKNLTIRIAGKTQANRLQGILDSHVTALRLAADAQLNLNAAESENAKILGQQRAQIAGVKAEWDRFIVTTGNAHVGFGKIGGGSYKSINETMVQYERAAKVGLRMYGNMFGENTGPSKPSIIDNWLTKKENELFPGQNEFMADSAQQQRMQGEASGHKELAKTYRLVGRGLEGGRPDESIANVSQLKGVLPGNNLEQLVRTGKIREAQAALEAAAQIEEQKGLTAANQALAMQNQLLAQATAMRDRAVEGSDAQKQAEQMISDIVAKRLEFYEEEDVQSGAYAERLEAISNILEQQKGFVQAIGDLYGQMPASTMTQKLGDQASLLEQQEASLQRAYTTLLEMSKHGYAGDPRVTGAMTQTQEQLIDVRSQRNALQSPERRNLAQLQDNRAIAFERAKEEASGYGVGRNEAEKLMNRANELNRQLRSLDTSDNGLTRGLALANELAKTHAEIQQRIIALRSQEKQIVFDTNREFQKGLLFSSPGELLQKLAVTSMPGQRDAGSFFAMDPSSRRIFDELHGGEAGRVNRSEQRFLRGQELTVAGQQSQSAQDSSRAEWYSRQLGMNAGRVGTPTGVDPLHIAARDAAGSVAAFGNTLAIATSGLQKLIPVVTALLAAGRGTREAGLPPIPRLNTGFSLGASVPNTHGATVMDFSK